MGNSECLGGDVLAVDVHKGGSNQGLGRMMSCKVIVTPWQNQC